MIAEKNGHTSIIALLKQFPLVQRAMALGSKPWNRSKVMLVGEGRVGKTALCNSMMGKPFVETESTVGLAQLTCDVRRAAATADGRWVEHTKPEREFEAGVAQLVRNMESSEPAEREPSQQPSESIGLREKKSVYRIKPPKPEQTDNVLKIEHNDSLFVEDIRSIRNLEEHNPGSVNVAGDDDSETRLRMTTESTPIHIKPDTMLVMNCLADVKVRESNLILSLFDFGGQSVFNIIHHLFLTSYGVYVVVFNMLDILDDNKREQSLSEMSFWINSIVMHTSDVMTGKMAPVFLVGTHKDYINDAVNFDRISQIIEERFQYNVGWPHIQENRNLISGYSLCFFPVSNKEGLRDGVVMGLMSAIENVIKESEYVKEPRPLTWLKALDELLATKKSYLPITEATSIAIENGVEVDAVPLFVSFLNEMGVVLWLNEEGLRDVVILDIISFFVEPATLIICNHISKPSDSTVHHRNIQEVCRKNRAKEWDEMTQRGLVGLELMEFLLAHKTEASNIPVIIHMMLKYGLIVRLEQIRSQDETSHVDAIASQAMECYLVPALLPATVGDHLAFHDNIFKHIKNFNSCYFIFCTASGLRNTSRSVSSSQLRNECFLPRGLMDRLVGKAVKLCHATNMANIHDATLLYQNYAVLSYGRQQFRLVCIPEINCIRLDIEGEYPVPVYDRISNEIVTSMKECMGSLQSITALRLGTNSELETGFTLLNLEAVREVHLKNISMHAPPSPAIDREWVNRHYGSWLENKSLLPAYDVFISYCQRSEDDSIFVDQLYDVFMGYIVGSEKRSVQVFVEKVRISVGQQRAVATSLVSSTIFVPVLSRVTHSKLLSHNRMYEDNVLIESMLALECMQNPTQCKMREIYPLMVGEWEGDESAGELLAEGVIDRLPDIVPTASIEVVRRLLQENGIPESSNLAYRTVRGVIKEITRHVGLKGWEYPNRFTRVASEDIVNRIDCISNMLTVFTGEYRGLLVQLKGYTPPKSCREHMLEDLPAALPGVAHLASIVINSAEIAPALPNPHGLSADEVLAVVAYTADAGSGKENSFYYHINNVLRQRKNESLRLLKPYLAYFMGAMGKLPAVKATVYRGVPIYSDASDELQKYEEGTKVHWSAFTSTSTDVESALEFRERGRPFIMFKIRVRNGRILSDYSLFPKENEVLLSPNSRFVVYQSYFAVMDGSSFVETNHRDVIFVEMIETKDGTLVF